MSARDVLCQYPVSVSGTYWGKFLVGAAEIGHSTGWIGTSSWFWFMQDPYDDSVSSGLFCVRHFSTNSGSYLFNSSKHLSTRSDDKLSP